MFTGAPRGLFVSPDGQWIGFVDNVTTLKKVAMTGGPAVTLATLDGSGPRGATWAPDDTVIVATNSGATGLQRVDLASWPDDHPDTARPFERRSRSSVARATARWPRRALHDRGE